MIKSYFFVAFILAFSQTAIAQTKQIDSLRAVLLEINGKERVDALNTLSHEISSYSYDNSVQLSAEAFAWAKKLNYTEGMAQSLLYEGVIAMRIGKSEIASKKFLDCIALSKDADVQYLKGGSFTYLGVMYQAKDQLDSADFFYKQSYQILKDSLKPLYLSFLYRNIAKLYGARNNAHQELNYLQRSWNIRKKLKDKRPLVHVGKDLVVHYTEQGDYPKSLSLLNEMQAALGKDTIDNEEIMIIYKERGIIHGAMGNYQAALTLFAHVRKFFERNQSQLEMVNLFGDMGNMLSFATSNYETSLKYFFKAIKIARENYFIRNEVELYGRVGWVYFLMEQYQLADEYSQKTLTAAREKYPYEEAFALNVLGLINTRIGNNKNALDYLNQALTIRKKNNYRTGEASTLLNLGILFEQMGELTKAEAYDLKSLEIAESLSKTTDISYCYQSLGQLYTKMKKFDKALNYLNKGEALSKKINAKDIVRDIYKNKRELFAIQNNFSQAYQYSVLYQHLQDSLFNQNLSYRISSMQYDFELDKKDEEIKFLNQQGQLQNSKLELQRVEIRQQRFIIVIGLVVFISIVLWLYFVLRFYKKVKKLNREISEQNEEITTQSEELIEANQALGKMNREISEQKEKIQAQAEELTESNQTIARVNSNLEDQVKTRTAELKEAYNELDTFFYRSSHDFRRPLTTFMGLAEVAKVTLKDRGALELFEKVNETAHNLDKMLVKLQSVSAVGTQELIYTEILLDKIFEIELDNFREEVIQKSIQVETEIKLEEPFFSYPVMIKYILQNLLENAISFSGVRSPFIKFKAAQIGGEIVLEVSDNGQGIEPAYLNRVFNMYFRANEKSKGNGLGLYIVKKMVDKLKGRVALKSEPGVGTTVWVYLPNQFNK